MQTKPQIRMFVNPILPRGTTITTHDGRHGKLADQGTERHDRLVVFEGTTTCEMVNVSNFARGRWEGGAEFTCTFDGKTLKHPALNPTVI